MLLHDMARAMCSCRRDEDKINFPYFLYCVPYKIFFVLLAFEKQSMCQYLFGQFKHNRVFRAVRRPRPGGQSGRFQDFSVF